MFHEYLWFILNPIHSHSSGCYLSLSENWDTSKFDDLKPHVPHYNCHILCGNSYVQTQVHYFVAWIWLHHQFWVAKSMLNPSFIPYLRCLDLLGPGPNTQVFGAAEEQAELEARKGFEGGKHPKKWWQLCHVCPGFLSTGSAIVRIDGSMFFVQRCGP
jgi:hypothetical protein